MLSRAEREVAGLRRELTRQRNLAGARGASTARPTQAAFDELAGRAARAREELREPGQASDSTDLPDGQAPQPRVGLWGRSTTLGSVGRIVEVSGRTGRVTLETDTSRVVVPSEDVEV